MKDLPNTLDQPLLNNHYVNSSFKWAFFFHNWETFPKRVLFFVRVTLIVGFTVLAVFNSLTGMMITKESVTFYKDKLFDFTSGLNQYFEVHDTERHLIEATSSFLVDFLLVAFSVKYALWGKSWREVICSSCFYTVRAAVQGIFLMGFPENYIWDYPGVPSLTVPYYRTADFFYSGHVGIMTFCALENYNSGYYKLMVLSVIATLFEFFVMVVLRAHYSIDLISGVVFAHYIWILSGRASKYIDSWLGYKVYN